MQQDLQHLRLLSIFYYVVAGLLALVSCVPIIHVAVGIMMIASPASMSGPGGGPPPALGWMFVLVGGSIILLGWATAVCLAVAGWHLGRCRHYIFCMVMAALACLFHPFGTILGVFTFIVLLRPSVKRLFETGGLIDYPDEGRQEDEDHPPRFFRDPALEKGDASHFTR
jgi:hypothetical protein